MTLDKVVNLMTATLKKRGIEISKDTDLVADLGLNSLDIAELVCVFEDEFQIEIPDRDIGKLRKISDIVAYLDNKSKE